MIKGMNEDEKELDWIYQYWKLRADDMEDHSKSRSSTHYKSMVISNDKMLYYPEWYRRFSHFQFI